MTTDYFTEMKFAHLLSFTFPGIFLVITFSMYIEYLTSQETYNLYKNLNALIISLAIIILFGTIFGVILDGIHHSLIEAKIFNNMPQIKKINVEYGGEMNNIAGKIDFDTFNGILIELERDYNFSEFYCNIFLAFIPFSYVLSVYMFGVMKIPWMISCMSSFLIWVLALLCFYCSYQIYYNTIVKKTNLINDFCSSDNSININIRFESHER